jgi:hypothetical protein
LKRRFLFEAIEAALFIEAIEAAFNPLKRRFLLKPLKRLLTLWSDVFY